MYVVEAIPDNKRNALAVVSAYIQKNGGSQGQVLNISQNEPQLTPETPVSSNAPATDTVTQEAPVVNHEVKGAGRLLPHCLFLLLTTSSQWCIMKPQGRDQYGQLNIV